MGLLGYEGECELWNVPDAQITVYHILVRIKHEMELLKKRTGRDFYLFGTQRPFVAPRHKFVENYGKTPIDILFTVNVSDLRRLDGVEEPSPQHLSRSSKGWRKMVNVDDGHSRRIPEEIHLWGGDPSRRYYGLAMSNFRYYRPCEERILRGDHLFYYLPGSPVKNWFRFAMGTLYVDVGRKHSAVPERRILATAKLMYPYVYEIRR